MSIIEFAFKKSKVIVMIFITLLIAGTISYLAIPKESEPDVPIPTFYVTAAHEGISPDDAERLLVKPLEKEFQSLNGLKEMDATAGEGFAYVMLEFDPGFNAGDALQEIRNKIARSKASLPLNTEEPHVQEVNVALFPILNISISGAHSTQELLKLADKLKAKIEAVPGVLEASMSGNQEEMVEVLIDPVNIKSYDLSLHELHQTLNNNNKIIIAGNIDTGAGKFTFKIPGLITNVDDLLQLPIKISNGVVVPFKNIATIRRTLKDPETFARMNGKPTIMLEIKKRLGANIINTIEDVRTVVAAQKTHWPKSVTAVFSQDKSVQIHTMLIDLQNNIMIAIILVMIVIVSILGVRPALLVGLAIPGSFLTGILVLYCFGYTINIVILFSLILVVGMLVDGAIVTIELADRKIADGYSRQDGYIYAAKRMSWPIIASTATTLAVFIPLIFWPGMVGEFMKYLPITVLITLFASLFMALIFIPVLGGLVGNKDARQIRSTDNIKLIECGNLELVKGFTGKYLLLLKILLQHPYKVLMSSLFLLVVSYVIYANYGAGIQFFPKIEPDFIQVQVKARGDLSIYEKDALMKKVESTLLDMSVFKTIYTRTIGAHKGASSIPEDVIGTIQLEFIPWNKRQSADKIITNVRRKLRQIAGVKTQVIQKESGPSAGKPVQIEVQSSNTSHLNSDVQNIRKLMREVGGFINTNDSRPLDSIEWRLNVNKQQAALSSVDLTMLGSIVQMATTGLKLGEYRPDDVNDALDIRARFPLNKRTLNQLFQLQVPTSNGHIPIANFVSFVATKKPGDIRRINAQRAITINSDVLPNLSVDTQVAKLKKLISTTKFSNEVSINFKGQDKEQREAGIFLLMAFVAALLFMIVILLVQFNSFYQTALVLSAIVFSTAGVLIGLLITGTQFGVVMCGIGIIALAGIVVNNNIVLIDTYNKLRSEGLEQTEAILRTAAQRLRPVLLTSFTTVLGLMPMVLSMNIDLLHREFSIGAPSTQWWNQLASTIVGGLVFATILTLVLTPCLLSVKKAPVIGAIEK